ncbi:unnamed protein product [Peniophora sp. CBMAI 1063]|nr:unnamed protein product [Peniophora sp. CBMAI 1063]
MAANLLEQAPPEFARVLAGLPVPPANGGQPNQDENYRLYAMANFIYAAVDQRSSEWTDYTSASSPYLPVTPSSQSLAGDNAHLPSFVVTREGSILDERIAEAIQSVLWRVPDVRARPSDSLPEMGIWSCPQCDLPIDPADLTVDQRVLIAYHMGVGEDCGVVEHADGRVQLDPKNPWQYLRSVDCLGWDHYAMHLRTECLILWYPSPVSAYRSAPGVWWDEDRLSRRQVYKAVRLENEALERTERHQLRMWKAKKMINLAKGGVHAARFHLTRWRRGAVVAREALVKQMFAAGRNVVDTGLALVALMDKERVDAERLRWQAQREQHNDIRREWEARKTDWSRMYLGV